MRIIAFNGSPKAEKSNTNVMVEAFLDGAKEAGAETENIFLAKKEIKPCIGCYNCWLKTPGECFIKDDVAEMLDKMINSDIIVYASPIFVGSVTGIMKNFIDRHLPLATPQITKSKNGLSCHKSRYEGNPKIVLISNAGFPEQEHFKYFRSIFEYMEMNSEMEIIAEIYRGAGTMLTIDAPGLGIIINSYKRIVKKAGKEVVENGRLSEQTKKELEMPLIPADLYLSQANSYFERELKKLKNS